MPELHTIRRWTLRPGADEAAVIHLVEDSILPAYRRCPGFVGLGLLRIEGSTSYFATTRWQSRDAFDEWAGPAGAPWREAYASTLEQWDALLAFEKGWETDVALESGLLATPFNVLKDGPAEEQS